MALFGVVCFVLMIPLCLCVLLCARFLLHRVCASRLTRVSHSALAQGTLAG